MALIKVFNMNNSFMDGLDGLKFGKIFARVKIIDLLPKWLNLNKFPISNFQFIIFWDNQILVMMKNANDRNFLLSAVNQNFPFVTFFKILIHFYNLFSRKRHTFCKGTSMYYVSRFLGFLTPLPPPL